MAVNWFEPSARFVLAQICSSAELALIQSSRSSGAIKHAIFAEQNCSLTSGLVGAAAATELNPIPHPLFSSAGR
jgi:hypothetical protein